MSSQFYTPRKTTGCPSGKWKKLARIPKNSIEKKTRGEAWREAAYDVEANQEAKPSRLLQHENIRWWRGGILLLMCRGILQWNLHIFEPDCSISSYLWESAVYLFSPFWNTLILDSGGGVPVLSPPPPCVHSLLLLNTPFLACSLDSHGAALWLWRRRLLSHVLIF